MGMRVLVTGGAGFIGSHVVDRLLAEGFQVTVLDDLSHGKRENLDPAAELIVGDIRDAEMVDQIVSRGFDAIVHLAAQKSVMQSMRNPRQDADINILGTLNLLASAIKHGVQRFSFASTGGALYGETDQRPTREDHHTNPESPYGMSKLAGETYIRHAARNSDLRVAILRLANVYGPRQDSSGEGGVVAIFCEKAKANEPVLIFGDGDQTRDYVYVGDVADAFVLSLAAAAKSIVANIGTGVETSVNDLAASVGSVNGSLLRTSTQPARPGEIRFSALDNRHARETLGWTPRTSIEEGLRQTYRASQN